MIKTSEISKPPLIKYIFIRENGQRDVSYSQIHDEYSTLRDEQTVDIKIQKDIKFYKHTALKGRLKIYVNNEFLKEVSV